MAAAPKGTKSCITQGESVRTSVCPSVHMSVPPLPHPESFVSFGAQIQTVWPKSRQNGPNLARKPEFWPEFYHFGPLNLDSGSQNPHPSLIDPDPDLWDPDSDLQDLGFGLKDLNPNLGGSHSGRRPKPCL